MEFAIGKQIAHISIRQGILAIPTDGEKNDSGWEAVKFEGIGIRNTRHSNCLLGGF